LRFGALLAFERSGCLDEPAPVFERFRRMAMNLQPCQCFAEGSAVHEGSSRTRGQVQIKKAALQAEDMPQPFDVPARQREQAK
jgi:hypothetical protein